MPKTSNAPSRKQIVKNKNSVIVSSVNLEQKSLENTGNTNLGLTKNSILIKNSNNEARGTGAERESNLHTLMGDHVAQSNTTDEMENFENYE